MIDLKLYRIFRKMGVAREDVQLKARLQQDFGFDSFDMDIFLFLLESKFDININDNEVMQLQTVDGTRNFVKEKID